METAIFQIDQIAQNLQFAPIAQFPLADALAAGVATASNLAAPAATTSAATVSFAAGLLPAYVSTALESLLNLYIIIVVIWALLSWFNQGKGLVNDIYQALDKIVSPYVNLFRKFIPPAGGMDFSPVVAIFVLILVGRFLIRLL